MQNLQQGVPISTTYCKADIFCIFFSNYLTMLGLGIIVYAVLGEVELSWQKCSLQSVVVVDNHTTKGAENMGNGLIDTLDLRKLGEELKRARKQRGLTQEDAAQVIKVARTTITAIENGERKIRAKELVELARAFGRPLSDFLRTRPALQPFQKVQFRGPTVQTDIQREKTEVSISLLEDMCRNYLELEQIMETAAPRQDAPEYKRRGTDLELEAEFLAQHERRRLGLGDGPLPAVRDILEQRYGLRVFYLELQPSNLSGIYYYSDELGGCLAVNVKQPEERCRWTMCHDLGHYLCDRHEPTVHFLAAYQRQPESERFADLFAKYLLMPAGGLTELFHQKCSRPNTISVQGLLALANQYGASVEAMTRRLEDLRLFKSGAYERLMDKGLRIRERQDEMQLAPVSGRRDAFPLRYRQLALEALESGKISEEQCANFLRLDRIATRQLSVEFAEQAALDSEGQ